METQEKTPEEKAINEKYHRRDRKYFLGILAGLVFGTALFIRGYSKSTYTNPFKDKPIVSKYEDITKTLDTLKNEKDNLFMLDFPYQPEHIKQHLNDTVTYETKKALSLEEAIKLVKADLQGIKQNPEFQAYENWEHKIDKLRLHVGSGGMLLMLLPFFPAVYFGGKNNEKRKKELEALKKS